MESSIVGAGSGMGGWPACVALVVAVQILCAAVVALLKSPATSRTAVPALP